MMKLKALFAVTSLFVAGLSLPSSVVFAEEQAVAAVVATTDVEATMKKMGLHFKQAMQATDVATMQEQVKTLRELTASVQVYQFTPEKQQVFQQGLSKVAAQLVLVQTALAEQNLEQAKLLLREVDSLKKQYHKERSPSFWDLLFGG